MLSGEGNGEFSRKKAQKSQTYCQKSKLQDEPVAVGVSPQAVPVASRRMDLGFWSGLF